MKIIEDKYTNKIKKTRITCDFCDSILEYDENDVYTDSYYELDYIDCPLCGHQILIVEE